MTAANVKVVRVVMALIATRAKIGAMHAMVVRDALAIPRIKE
jgi:hypothetical protein